MIQLDYKSGMPICDQVVNGVIRLKALGVLSAGDQLPSVRALALQLSVNPNTIQKAYHILENDSVIYSVQGKGSFVSGDEAAHNAVIQKAKNGFADAVVRARELGLRADDLMGIIDEKYKGGESE